MRRIERSVVVREAVPVAEENVEVKRSLEKMRDVFDDAILDAWLSTALDAA